MLNFLFQFLSKRAFAENGQGAVGLGLEDLGKSLDGILKTFPLQEAAVGDEVFNRGFGLWRHRPRQDNGSATVNQSDFFAL